MDIQFDLYILFLILITAAISFVFGRQVQRYTHFLWPHDFISDIVYITFFADIVSIIFRGVTVTPLPMPLWAVVLVCYLLGFWAASYKAYLHMLMVSTTGDLEMPYIVPYINKEAVQCLQLQTNRELLKRLIFGIHTEIETNCPSVLREVRTISIPHPWYPIPLVGFIPTEVYKKDFKLERHAWWQMKHYTAMILVAPEGMATTLEIMYRLGAHQKDIEANYKMRVEMYKAKYTEERDVLNQVSDAVVASRFASSSGIKLFTYFQEKKKMEENEASKESDPGEKKWHILSHWNKKDGENNG